MRKIHSKNSIFLLEILLNVLLFSFLLMIGLQFFIHAHVKTRETSQLYQAVTSCNDAAAVFESGDGTLSSLLQNYHYSLDLDNRVLIYLDDQFRACPKSSVTYTITVTLLPADIEGPSRADISCSTQDENVLYRMQASHYTQQTAQLLSPEEELSWQNRI